MPGKKTSTGGLSLPRLIAGVLFVNDVNAPLALDDLAVGVALLERLQRIGDFHGSCPSLVNEAAPYEQGKVVVK